MSRSATTNRRERVRRVLIVDDVPANVRLAQAYLGQAGYEVLTAGGGEEGLRTILDEEPDLVLLDVMMPRLSGLDVCRSIKSDPRTRHIPVILLTSLSELEDKVRGQEAGADDFISKPVLRLELLLRVRSMLRIKSLHDQLAEKIAELELAKQELRRLANTDALTGLHNKRYFEEYLARELERAARYQRPVSLLMLDIDHFKRFNDTFGHPTGDLLLQQLAELFAQNIRKIDLAARYGGEEFALVLLETHREEAAAVGEKLRRRVEGHRFVGEGVDPIGPVTISMGVANFPDDARTRDGLVALADRRLYLAKRRGRNRVVSTHEAHPQTDPRGARPAAPQEGVRKPRP